MQQRMKPIKMCDIPVYEHLEYHLKKTTYAHRLLWLEQANEFVRSIQRKRPVKTLQPKKDLV